MGVTAVGGKSLEEEYRERLQSWAFCAVTDNPAQLGHGAEQHPRHRMCGRDPHVDIPSSLDNEFSKGFLMDWWRLTQVFARLMIQTIATRRREKAPRPGARRWKREHGGESPYITVVTLRRGRSHETQKEGDVDWKHRWIVGGHWRNQWFPSLMEHRQIYIAPHVKGPEDKPLVVREGRAFEFVR